MINLGFRVRRYGALIFLLALSLVGCNQVDKSLEAEDETNPHIHQALAFQREFDFTDAAKAYESALQACPTLARAHFELGLLYADRLDDPIRAMYHFQCYINQRPQADNREGAQKRLESIKIQFAATVPNSPIETSEAFTNLQKANQELLKDLNDARAMITSLEAKQKPEAGGDVKGDGSTQASTPIAPLKETPDIKSDVPLATVPEPTAVAPIPSVAPSDSSPPAPPVPSSPPPTVTVSNGPPPATPPAVEIAPTTSPTPNPPPATTPAPEPPVIDSKTTYTIANGDTLWSIAKKYYPGQINAGIKKIKNANTDKLVDGKPLKIGLILVIPQ